MSEYTPTTSKVRAAYILDAEGRALPRRAKQFDRWLAAHDSDKYAYEEEANARLVQEVAELKAEVKRLTEDREADLSAAQLQGMRHILDGKPYPSLDELNDAYERGYYDGLSSSAEPSL